MRIKFIQDATADGVSYKRGDDAEIADRIADKLIVRGFAEAWSEAAAEAVEPDQEADDADPVC